MPLMSTAGATIREGLLAAVVDHLLELDVEIRWQDISERPGTLFGACNLSSIH